MTFERGGLADKLGNRYEGRWVVKQLLALLDEEIRSVTIEAIGDDERGVDLWIENNNGIRQAQQCKARNASNESWTIGDLNSRGILSYLQFQLNRDPNYQFTLVSSLGFELFKDICNFARRSNNNPELFYQNKILAAGKEVQRCFLKFCTSLALDQHNNKDLHKAFDYLKRTDINLYPDDQNAWKELLGRAGYLLTGDPENNISLLINYAENNDKLGSPIYVDELREYLTGHKIYPKMLSYDKRIAPAVNELQIQFLESIRPLLIRDKPLQRQETFQLFEAIKKNKNIIVHGAAGYGKSGVLYELTQQLQQNNTPYLPIRLDRKEPKNTAIKFGEDLGLPDCPAHCLTALAGKRQAVLILDQLDALRWTSAHTNNSLDVCKELLRRIQTLRLADNTISIVLSCRTYDLEHDPEIRNWLTGTTAKEFDKIEVHELDPKTLRQIIGSSYLSLTAKEIKILANPQNLAMWLKLSEIGSVASFSSATELIRRFWKNRRLVLDQEAGVSSEQMDNVLNPLVAYMEQKGKISAPMRVIRSYPKISAALKSYGILQEEAGQISFCHQLYLDFLIADRLMLQIDEGTGDILDWLGSREQQSLFRREQLRQVLVMLSEESPNLFLNEVRAILKANSVRFHVKHLILELIGLQETVTDDLYNFCYSLFQEDSWKEHILETVFLAHFPYIQLLVEKGVIVKWLDSENKDSMKKYAFLLLRSVAEKIPDFVANVLEPYIEKGGEWLTQILNTLPWKIAADSEHMFQLRLQLVRMGYAPNFVDWKSLCAKHPLRSIQLIEAVISTWDVDDEKEPLGTQKYRLKRWYDQDSKALNTAVAEHPAETWNLLLPQISRLTCREIKPHDWRREKWTKEGCYVEHYTDIARGVVELVILAGQQMAANTPDELVSRTTSWENSPSPIIQEILMEVYTKLPESFAEIGILWLLNDTSRFALGAGYDEPEWQPAARLIQLLSPHCSEDLFQKLEDTIVHYHAPDEKQRAKYCLKCWRNGYFRYYRGQAQYFLLPALEQAKVQSSTKALSQVLIRKFALYPEHRFLRSSLSSGGTVGSKLDQNLEKISGHAWLKIVVSEKVTKEGWHKWIQNGPHSVLEASIGQFARSLKKIATRYPQRFGELALQFPNNVPSPYISSILDGLTLTKPDNNTPDEEKSSWQPASVETIEAFLQKFKTDDTRETAMSFCRLIINRAEENWSDTTIERLLHYTCDHPDLEPGKLNIHCDQSADEASVDTLYQNTINCVRGSAARAMGQLLWQDYDWFDKLRPGFEALVQDPHVSVRMAATEAILPVLNIDKDLAVSWFCNACSQDTRVAASHGARQFFNYTVQSHFEIIGPVIQKMIHSSQEDVVQEGATQVTARWLFHEFFEQELQECRQGTVSQRKGVAQTAAQFFTNKKYSNCCQDLLLPLLNDQEREVRDQSFHIFHKTDFLFDDQLKPFMKKYVTSQTFCDHPGRFVDVLQNTTGSLIPLSGTIFSICEVFSTTLQEKARDVSTSMPHNVSEILSVLLRLYEQASNTDNLELINRCLDILDMLFQNRVGVINDLMKTIEQ